MRGVYVSIVVLAVVGAVAVFWPFERGDRKAGIGNSADEGRSLLTVTVPPEAAGRLIDSGGYSDKILLRIGGADLATIAARLQCGNLSGELINHYSSPRQRFILTIERSVPELVDVLFDGRSSYTAIELSPSQRTEGHPRQTGHYAMPLARNADGNISQLAECQYYNGLRTHCRIRVQVEKDYGIDFVAAVPHAEDWESLIATTSCIARNLVTVERSGSFSSPYLIRRDESSPFSLPEQSRAAVYCLDHLLPKKLVADYPVAPIAEWPRRCFLKLLYEHQADGTTNYGRWLPTEEEVVPWKYGLNTASYAADGSYLGPRTLHGNIEYYFGDYHGQLVILQCMAKDEGVTPWCSVGYPMVSAYVSMHYRFPLEWLPAWKRVHAFVLSQMLADYSFPKREALQD